MSFKVRFTVELLDEAGVVVSKITGDGDQKLSMQTQTLLSTEPVVTSALISMLSGGPEQASVEVKAQAQAPKPQVAPKLHVNGTGVEVDVATVLSLIKEQTYGDVAKKLGIPTATIDHIVGSGKTTGLHTYKPRTWQRGVTRPGLHAVSMLQIRELIKEDLTVTQMAKRLGCSNNAIYSLMSRNKTSTTQLRDEMEKSGELKLYAVQ